VSRPVLLTLLSRAVQLLAGFAGTIVTARFLGPEQRGEYFFVVTLTLVIVQFANLGLQSSNTFYVARDGRLLSPLIANSLWVSLLLGGGSAAVAVAVLHRTGLFLAQEPSLMWLAVALSPPILFFMLGTNLLVGTQRMIAFNVIEVVANVGVTAALVLGGLASFGAKGFLIVSSSAWSAASLVVLTHLWRQGRVRIAFSRDVFATGFRYAAKAYLVTALGFLVLRANVFVLQHYFGSRELGFYSIAAQVGDAIAILPGSVALVLFPRLVKDPAGRWRSTVRTACVVGVLLAVACGIAAAVAGPFIRLAFGQAFAPAAAVLRLLLPGVFALGVSTVLSQYLAAIGIPRVLVGVWVVTLAAVLSLGAVLVPHHAGAGAAAALSCAYGGALLMIVCVAYRYRRSAEAPQDAVALQPIEVPESAGGTA
jgi:enterobacterial common antigen flippase